MARRIDGTIYMIKYLNSMVPEYVECENEIDLFEYIVEKQIAGNLFCSANEICKDGSRPKVSVLTNKTYKNILKAFKNPPEIIVEENYWHNDRGYHYSLTPINEKDREILSQFWIDTTSLKRARESAEKWIKRHNHLKIVIKNEKRKLK